MSDFRYVFFIFLSVISNTAVAQNIDELQQLLDPFSDTKHLKLAYQEKRFSLFFKQPQIYEGYIEYISPDTFIKQVQNPGRKKIIIIGDLLTLYNYNDASDPGYTDKKTVSLDDYPKFKQFKALFSALFQGRAAKLNKYYRYEIEPLTDNKTRLQLTSRINDPFTQENLQQNIIFQQIEIIFQKKHILKITMTGLGGERSELIFQKDTTKKLFNENNDL